MLRVVVSLLPVPAAFLIALPSGANPVDASVKQMVPRITYPAGQVETLSPRIAWMGPAHDACQVRIAVPEQHGGRDVWRSGTVETSECHIRSGQLPPNSELTARVRIRSGGSWSDWSEPATFRTPAVPVLKLENPTHAARIRGPKIDVRWRVETTGEVLSQAIRIDGGEPVSVSKSDTFFVLRDLEAGVHTVSVEVTTTDGPARAEATFYLYRLDQLSDHRLYILNLRHLMHIDPGDPRQAASAFDTLHLAAVLQGLVNREVPRLYLDYTAVDRFWLDLLRSEDGYLERCELAELERVEDALEVFAGHIKGAVVWDPEVPATSNVASTICGVEDLIPVRYDESPDSLYSRLVAGGPRIPVVYNLVGKFTGAGVIPDIDRQSTGSAKCDAYIWAKVKFLDTGACNPLLVGYYCDAFWLKHPQDMSLDNVGLTNQDFVVSRRGFVCDLNVWSDDIPRDDPQQQPGTDRATLQEILLSCYTQGGGRMIHIAGFTPWAIKYTDAGNAGGKHDAVATEWETVRLVSAYNGFLDADAIGHVAMANASVFAHYPLPDRLVQNPPPTREDLRAKGYLDADGNVARLNFLYHYLGDYDAAAWIYNRMPEIWRNPVRGAVPSGWAFNPNLIERIAPAFDWFYNTKSPVDYFIAGDSGAGYVNPTQLLPPRNPSGLASAEQAWIEHNSRYFRRLNYSITGFIINGFSGVLNDDSNRMYLPFSGDGLMTQTFWMPAEKKHDHMLEWMPVAGMKQDITAPVDVVVAAILKHGRPDETRFLSFRSILVGPDWIKKVNDEIRAARPDCRFEPVDPYTYFYLLRHHLGGTNEMRATCTFDTMPARVNPGEKIRITAGLRNDGWDTWRSDGADAVRVCAGFGGSNESAVAALPHDTRPSQGVVVTLDIPAPSEPGEYEFWIDLRRGEQGWFEDAGDLPWRKTVTVESTVTQE